MLFLLNQTYLSNVKKKTLVMKKIKKCLYHLVAELFPWKIILFCQNICKITNISKCFKNKCNPNSYNVQTDNALSAVLQLAAFKDTLSKRPL